MAHAQMLDDDDPLLHRLRAIALGLPEAAEKISHGRPTFFTKKTFAIFGGTVKIGPKQMEQRPHSVLILPDPADAEVLLEWPDSYVPMYLGPSGWIGLEIVDLDDGEVLELLVDSYRNTASARLVRTLDTQQ
ncbi:MmcQ/YjbR family DNA-binding protein [Brevibacterium spongiae]|uniref:MmcQ/YjbR family DNA-binding protein n=1 Tax=Brevibacterium spongiae TaxID=2909672 RepID=A0ABY5STG5_9MICO|nr:MmcQ/YjbR family DNA-binding protein [Brevibacterium spongiae]UVI36354.1 MmcQ/YjbR family DNA-binding protein [Brevibacterium spongiae]